MSVVEYDLRIDGAEPLSKETVRRLADLCDRVESLGLEAPVTVALSGAPALPWTAPDLTLATRWERAVRRFERLDAATVGVAAGDVGGTALDVLLATDVRVASPDTRLLVPVTAGGAWPGMAIYRLVRQAGIAAARRTVLLGRAIEAAEAVALGLLNDTCDDPAEALARVARAAAGLPGRELAIRRRLMDDAVSTSFEEALGAHLAACDRALRRSTSGAGA